jgi:hypothetical protein
VIHDPRDSTTEAEEGARRIVERISIRPPIDRESRGDGPLFGTRSTASGYSGVGDSSLISVGQLFARTRTGQGVIQI